MSDAPLTPCVQICVIHRDTGLCTGCLRSRDEIAGWSRMSNEDRAALMDTLPARAAQLRKRRGGRAGRMRRQNG